MLYKTIKVALVGHKDEAYVINETVRLSNALDASLTVIHVNDPHAGEISMMMDTPGHRYTEQEFRNLFRTLGHPEIANQMKIQIIQGEVIHKEIAKASKGADLLILGHRRMNSFKDRFFDSVDEGIINNVDCPVLVVPRN